MSTAQRGFAGEERVGTWLRKTHSVLCLQRTNEWTVPVRKDKWGVKVACFSLTYVRKVSKHRILAFFSNSVYTKTTMKKIITASLAVALFGIVSSAFAATDYLLKLDGVDGETKSTVTPETSPTTIGTGARTESQMQLVAPPPPRPNPLPPGDPDFDLLKVTPPPAPPKPTPAPSGDPDFDLLKIAPSPASPGSGERKKGNVDMQWKVEEGEKLTPDKPELDIRDDDDDGDNVSTIDEDIDVSVSKVVVRGWDPKKKEEFMRARKDAADVHSKQELEHFAQGVLLDDEQIVKVQFNPKEISVSYETEGKLLWFIPVSYNEQLVARGTRENDEVTFEVKKPWWGFLVSEDDDDDAVAEEAKKKHKETHQIDSWSWGVSNSASLLKTISNVLKTKHDAAKNSISNVR